MGGAPTLVRGKFFAEGEARLHLRGVTYGPFAPASDGTPFPEGEKLDRDLRLAAELGANCLRTFTVPPRRLLDAAGAHGLRVLATVPWSQHVCFLDRRALRNGIRGAVREAARACDHPAI